MKTILSLNRVATQLDGSAYTDSEGAVTLNKLLASGLANSTKGDALKYYDWARTLYKEGELELDRSDFEHLKEFVKNQEASAIIKAQLLECFVLAPPKEKE